MTAKEFLSEIYDNKMRIKALQARRDECYDLGLSTGIPQVRNDASHHGSRVESSVERIVDDIGVEINQEIEALLAQQRKANRIIKSLPNAKWRDVLNYRYLNGWAWSKVARAMNYNKRWTQQLHREALDAFERAMNKGGIT